MPQHIFKRLLLIATLTLATAHSWAHVPYLEHHDFSEKQPFTVEYSIEQSLAIYAWLENTVHGPAEDIDVFVFRINEPTNVYLEVLVPVCPGYEAFLPWLALVGPGLPAPKAPMPPFEIPADYGIIVIQNLTPGQPRNTFYEFFGGKNYYKGPIFDEILTTPGTYYVYCWDPQQKGGDYVAVMGKNEIWRWRDIIQAFRNTPLIRLGRELHIDCSKPSAEDTQELEPTPH
jgi:hypothetical protein